MALPRLAVVPVRGGVASSPSCDGGGAPVAEHEAAPRIDGSSRLDERAEKEDDEAVGAFQKGDRRAFDRLVLKYQKMIYRLAVRYTGSHQDADDLAQEIFLRAYRGLGAFRAEARFSTWLYRIGVNACLNWVGGRRAGEKLPDHLVDPRPGALERLSRDEASRELREAISKLPDKQRATLVLRVYQDMSHKEIAEVMESPVGTVKANLFFAIENLRKIMKVRRDSK